MRARYATYTSYSVSCAVVWAVLLTSVWVFAGDSTRHNVSVLFAGWVIGWLSATIARVVYPPPRPHKTSAD